MGGGGEGREGARKGAREGGREGGREGVSRYYVEMFLSNSTETFRRGIFLCCVSKNFR